MTVEDIVLLVAIVIGVAALPFGVFLIILGWKEGLRWPKC